jgi:Arc/MetJ family transcription regulator
MNLETNEVGAKGFSSISCFNQLCHHGHMATNLKLDDALLQKVVALSGKKTKREAVNEALAEFVQRRERLKILEFFGTMEMHEPADDKIRLVKRERTR